MNYCAKYLAQKVIETPVGQPLPICVSWHQKG